MADDRQRDPERDRPSSSDAATLRSETLKLLPAFLLTTVVGGILTFAFQCSAAERDAGKEERAANRENATKIFDEVSRATGARLSQAYRRLVWRGRYYPRQRTPASIAAMTDSLFADWVRDDSAWSVELNRNRAQICRYFGVREAEFFEDSVNWDIRQIEWEMEDDIREAPETRDSVPTRAWEAWRRATDAAYRLNNHLIEAVRSARFAADTARGCDALDLNSPFARDSAFAAEQRRKVAAPTPQP
jgi:hypothetical protein